MAPIPYTRTDGSAMAKAASQDGGAPAQRLGASPRAYRIRGLVRK